MAVALFCSAAVTMTMSASAFAQEDTLRQRADAIAAVKKAAEANYCSALAVKESTTCVQPSTTAVAVKRTPPTDKSVKQKLVSKNLATQPQIIGSPDCASDPIDSPPAAERSTITSSRKPPMASRRPLGESISRFTRVSDGTPGASIGR